jgi:hypothetical protein
MKPTKTIITRSPREAAGAVTLEWLQPESIHYQQKFERAAVYILALVPGITRIVHQPIKVKLGLPERDVYTPDFGLEFHTGEIAIVEVKPRVFIEKHTAIFDAAVEALKHQEMSFHVLYEQQLSPTRTRTAEHFAFLANRQAPQGEVDRLVKLIDNCGKLSFGGLEQHGFNVDIIGHAIGRRLLCMEPSLTLKKTTWVSSPRHCAGTYSPSYWLQAKPWGEEGVTLPPIAEFPMASAQFLPRTMLARPT